MIKKLCFVLLIPQLIWARPRSKAQPLPIPERPKVEVTVKSSNRFFGHHYLYTVANQSAKPLRSFSLVLETAKVGKCWAPKGWEGKATPVLGSTSVEWNASPGSEIAPGQRLKGFAVLSPSPEGRAEYRVQDTGLVQSRAETRGPLQSIQDKPRESSEKTLTCKEK